MQARGKVKARLGQGQGKVKTRSGQVHGNVKVRSRRGSGKLKARSRRGQVMVKRQGQVNINPRLKQSNYNHNHYYNLIGFDTIEINLVPILTVPPAVHCSPSVFLEKENFYNNNLNQKCDRDRSQSVDNALRQLHIIAWRDDLWPWLRT